MRPLLLGLCCFATWASGASPPPSPPPPFPYPEYRPHVHRISIATSGLRSNLHAWGVVDRSRYYASASYEYTCESSGGDFTNVIEHNALTASWGDLGCLFRPTDPNLPCSTDASLTLETIEFFVREGSSYSICGFSTFDTYFDNTGTVTATDTVTVRTALLLLSVAEEESSFDALPACRWLASPRFSPPNASSNLPRACESHTGSASLFVRVGESSRIKPSHSMLRHAKRPRTEVQLRDGCHQHRATQLFQLRRRALRLRLRQDSKPRAMLGRCRCRRQRWYSSIPFARLRLPRLPSIELN